LADFVPESLAAVESSAAALSFFDFFLDFFVVAVESSVDDCGFANAGETVRVISRHTNAAHRLSLRVFVIMDVVLKGRFRTKYRDEWRMAPAWPVLRLSLGGRHDASLATGGQLG
jgi:hypothetical protein